MATEVEWLLREKYKGVTSSEFFTDCKRLETGEPLAYIIGHIPFLNCQIWLDSKPLIPRTETEFWVEKAIHEIISRAEVSPQSFDILDLCAGSGAIGVAVAKAFPDAGVVFAELDKSHLPTVQKNLLQNLSINQKVLEKRYKVIESDLFEHVIGTFDFILTNPPYIDKERGTVDQSVLIYEPNLALFGDKDGMKLIERIIADARTFLKPNGQLWIEHEPFQSESILKLASVYGLSSAAHTDQYGVIRYSIIMIQ